MEPVDKKYNFLKPIKTPNLIRFGGKLDGGYVVDLEIVKKCNTLITFGLGPDWSFELDYIKKNKEILLISNEQGASALDKFRKELKNQFFYS